MSENIIEVFDTCGKEIKALKEIIKIKDWEIDSLRDKNKALYERIEDLESRVKPLSLKGEIKNG